MAAHTYWHKAGINNTFFQRFHFAASKFHASWIPTPAPREGISCAPPPHIALLSVAYMGLIRLCPSGTIR